MKTYLLSIALLAQLMGISFSEALEETAVLTPSVSQSLSEDAAEELLTLRVQHLIQEQYDERPLAQEPLAIGKQENQLSLNAWSAIAIDADTGMVLWEKNPDTVLPIASITKLMTASIWLDNQPSAGFDHVHTVAPEGDTPIGKELNLPHLAQISTRELWDATLVASTNDTAMALVHSTTLGEQGFIDAMNRRAQTLGLTNTAFADPTGLSERNTSTAHDIAQLARHAFSHSEIQEATQLAGVRPTTVDGISGRYLTSTNALLSNDALEIVGGKTGYIPEAGYCLVLQIRIPDTDRDIITVVLGTPSSDARFTETSRLIDWVQQYYSWD